MRILYVEPFEGGSHASFTRALTRCVPADWTRLTLPARHWKWRMRGSAVWAALSQAEVVGAAYDLLWASSFVPLAELVGLVPSLAKVPRVLYFHENQLSYPWREGKVADRDLHYGVTQLVSALAATRCVFNSAYNRDSFLQSGRELLAKMPDAVPAEWIETIEARSSVLGVPLALADDPPPALVPPTAVQRAAGPTILWNHRWEHDKNPAAFFGALAELADKGVAFQVAVCGQRYRRAPDTFERARESLGERVTHWGHLPDRAHYLALLERCDIAVSTANHEFFGVAMLEATHCGAYPLVADRLAYPELFPSEYRYGTDAELVERLEALCRRYSDGAALRRDRRGITQPHAETELGPQYAELVGRLAGDC